MYFLAGLDTLFDVYISPGKKEKMGDKYTANTWENHLPAIVV